MTTSSTPVPVPGATSSTSPRAYLLNGGSLDELKSKYAITARRHATYTNLVSLKYHQIESPMGEPIVQQCRGIVLDQDDDWRIVSRPFDKFFNYGEGHAAPIDWSTAQVLEKLDGSLMSMYWYDGDWQVASSGTPDAGGDVNGNQMTFADLFWSVHDELGYARPANPENTYMFELMTRYNRVVVPHAKNRLVLIGIRHTESGAEESVHAPSNITWERVRTFPLQSFADVERTFATLDPLHQEGYVVVDAVFRRVKVKHPGYVAIHHMRDGFGPKAALEIVRSGETSELLTHFPEWRGDVEATRAKFDALVAEVEADYARLHDIPVQKDFALQAVKTRYSPALFAMRAGKAESFRRFFADVRINALMELLGMRDGGSNETP
jgi:hypothetical protein